VDIGLDTTDVDLGTADVDLDTANADLGNPFSLVLSKSNIVFIILIRK
jgi:hypothetical protein